MNVVTPLRATHTYTQRLVAPAEDVFPLLCPVREVEWAHDWAPSVVYSHSGLAEKDCVFVTTGEVGDEVWVITQHDAEERLVEMFMVSPTVVVTRIRIQLRPSEDGCEAHVCYTKTSLGPRGDEEVAGFTEDAWRQFMTAWERELNNYLVSRGAPGARPGMTSREASDLRPC